MTRISAHDHAVRVLKDLGAVDQIPKAQRYAVMKQLLGFASSIGKLPMADDVKKSIGGHAMEAIFKIGESDAACAAFLRHMCMDIANERNLYPGLAESYAGVGVTGGTSPDDRYDDWEDDNLYDDNLADEVVRHGLENEGVREHKDYMFLRRLRRRRKDLEWRRMEDEQERELDERIRMSERNLHANEDTQRRTTDEHHDTRNSGGGGSEDLARRLREDETRRVLENEEMLRREEEERRINEDYNSTLYNTPDPDPYDPSNDY